MFIATGKQVFPFPDSTCYLTSLVMLSVIAVMLSVIAVMLSGIAVMLSVTAVMLSVTAVLYLPRWCVRVENTHGVECIGECSRILFVMGKMLPLKANY